MDLIVVGMGWAGQQHVMALQSLCRDGRDVRIAALVDTDAAHLAGQAERFGVAATYETLEAALSGQAEASGVVIATPHHLHRAGTEAAAAAGRHVLVEKPIALTLDDADAMIDACEAANVTLMVAESARFQRPMITAAELIRSGAVGELLSGRINLIGRGGHDYGYPGRRVWLADPAVCGGGIWMLNGIHRMSAARMLLGEVTRIDAREVHSTTFASDLEATVIALVEFDSGAVATMTVSAELRGYQRFGDTVIFGSEGSIECRSGEEGGVRLYQGESLEPRVLPCAEHESAEGARSYFPRQMAAFLDAVELGRDPGTGGRSERQTLAAIVAGYESTRSGQPVVVSPRPEAS